MEKEIQMKRSHARSTTTFDKGSITVEDAKRMQGHPAAKQTRKKLQKRKARQNGKRLTQEPA